MAHSNGSSQHSQNQYAIWQRGLFTNWRVMLLHSHLLWKTARRCSLCRNKHKRADFNNCLIHILSPRDMYSVCARTVHNTKCKVRWEKLYKHFCTLARGEYISISLSTITTAGMDELLTSSFFKMPLLELQWAGKVSCLQFQLFSLPCKFLIRCANGSESTRAYPAKKWKVRIYKISSNHSNFYV